MCLRTLPEFNENINHKNIIYQNQNPKTWSTWMKTTTLQSERKKWKTKKIKIPTLPKFQMLRYLWNWNLWGALVLCLERESVSIVGLRKHLALSVTWFPIPKEKYATYENMMLGNTFCFFFDKKNYKIVCFSTSTPSNPYLPYKFHLEVNTRVL